MIKIRKIEPEACRVLSDEVLTYADGESTWDADGFYWGAFDGELLVGFVGYVLSPVFSDCIYMHSEGVAAAYRGRKLQKRLIRAALRGAKRAGIWGAYTYTIVSNVASSRAQISCGFKPYWPVKPWAGDVCYWWRQL